MSEEIEEGVKILPKTEGGKNIGFPYQDVYLYKDSGIEERHGVVPIWLQIVAYGLIIWGIYYTIKYWSVG